MNLGPLGWLRLHGRITFTFIQVLKNLQAPDPHSGLRKDFEKKT
jgi:hypothetical protein